MPLDPETQESTRKEVVGGSVTAEEKAHIEAARTRAGYQRMSHCVRDVMLKWSDGVLRAADAA